MRKARSDRFRPSARSLRRSLLRGRRDQCTEIQTRRHGPAACIRILLVRHYVVHSLARGEWRYCCALASVQGRAYTYRYPARNHFLPLFAADFRRNEHQCGLALLAYSFGTDSLCLHDGSTLSSVRGHPDTRSSLSLIFSGHILPVYES